ncbi:MAG: hypothetical protein FWG94_08145 [Oscillospiraceae bacterium]|nr:hypothetical protein [Oscillospiraceae bacterium]
MKKAVFVILLSMAISFIVGCGGGGGSTVDAQVLASVRFEGLDTKGKIQLVSSDSAIARLVNEFAESNNNDMQKAILFEKALNSIRYEVASGKIEGFSNGEDVQIKATYDETLMKEANIKLENTEFTYTVSGLQEAKEIDLFVEIEVVFEGISPDVKARVFNRSGQQYVRDIGYNIEPHQNLRIGDVVTVTANVSDERLERDGYIMPDTISKEFTVEGVDKYIMDFSEVSQEALDWMKREAVDLIESDCANQYRDIIKKLARLGEYTLGWKEREEILNANFDTPELTNIYLSTLKQGESRLKEMNRIYLVYRITAHITETEEPFTRSAYMAVIFENAVLKADGNTEVKVVSYPYSYKRVAAEDFDKLYREAISAIKANYEIQEIQP